MKFILFFMLLTLYVLWILIVSPFYYAPLLVWLFFNFLTMSIAYGLNKPWLLLGKKKSGEVNLFLLVLNFPWLLFTWLIFHLQMFLSGENRVDEIGNTAIFIASKPLKGFDFTAYDLVVDLTAEFLKSSSCRSKQYRCYPNLDAMPLMTLYEDVSEFKNKSILVHCANGHGRSALFVAHLLVDLNIVFSIEDGLKLISLNRPLAILNKEQRKSLC